ncbi:PTS glucose transporter subunit IIA [Orenia metallireducens]|uniref:PTS glucose transporter subunit IIA n=1 Tax=Orenia metallireducens TaxID=1413210 RepID=A0A1C0AA95_9FIRM|nr:PTS glucose transporter subunit IIA [Orenia metallireducens]OCL27210.1 PTS glucose transporter subunit IIA [Orenia metallireducens]
MFNIFNKNNKVEFLAPMTGEIVKIEDVPDKVFAEKMLGDGIAINPSEGTIVAPCSGEIIQIFPTNHAVGIKTETNLELLIHIGIDTVKLNGKGFESFIEKGDKVKAGDKLIKIDLDYVKENAKSLITPLVITNMSEVDKMNKQQGSVVSGKDQVMEVIATR